MSLNNNHLIPILDSYLYGAVRLQEALLTHGKGKNGPAFLSTHPSGKSRVARLKELAQTLSTDKD